MRPVGDSNSPRIRRSNVVFPAPFGPTIATPSPRRINKDRCSKILCVSKLTDTSSSSSTRSAHSSGL